VISLTVGCTIASAFDSHKYATKKSLVAKEVLFIDMLLCMKGEGRHIKQSLKLFISLKTLKLTL
jgi:hypothetical protein